MEKHKFQGGDIVQNICNGENSLVTKVEGNHFLLADEFCPQEGYKTYLPISPNYKFVKHLSDEEYEARMHAMDPYYNR